MSKIESIEDFIQRGGEIKKVNFHKAYAEIKRVAPAFRKQTPEEKRFTEIILKEAHYDKVNGTLIKNDSKTVSQKCKYLRIHINNKFYMVHRLIWFLETGKMPTKILDHINGNGRDNRIENLREVTTRQNNQNLKRHRDGRLVGATRIYNGKWRAAAQLNGKLVVFGIFESEEEANDEYIQELQKRGIECL